MGLEVMVMWSVFRKTSEDELEKMHEIIVDSGDDAERVYKLPHSGGVSLVFQLRDDPKMAKSLATSTVAMPWVKIEPDGKEIQLSKQEKQVHNEYFSNAEVCFGELDIHKNQEIHCGECLLFSRDKGVEILELETHTFVDGEKGKMNSAIVDALAETHGRPTLTPSNVGYCPKLRMLCADVSPGCAEAEAVK
jgi:hypothetical protein